MGAFIREMGMGHSLFYKIVISLHSVKFLNYIPKLPFCHTACHELVSIRHRYIIYAYMYHSIFFPLQTDMLVTMDTACMKLFIPLMSFYIILVLVKDVHCYVLPAESTCPSSLLPHVALLGQPGCLSPYSLVRLLIWLLLSACVHLHSFCFNLSQTCSFPVPV